ncbi:MAG: L-serine ammonia-lyase, iron-sulfur-dependent, subunit alpha [Thermoleophilia bacterium]
MPHTSLAELAAVAAERGLTIGAIAREGEAAETETPETELNARMARNLQVMREATARGLAGVSTRSGLAGGDAQKMVRARGVAGEPLDTAIARALAVSEVNAAMGRIVAAPTAGSAGVLPAVILTVGERVGASDEQLVEALFTAGGVGQVIAAKATLAGAEGGCQAECGSAAAMAAAAAVQLAGGTPGQCVDAVAIALKGSLGLVCDPVAGLVEVPCIKRNGLSAAAAVGAADMALAGIRSVIPADEVIVAMGEVGRAIPASLRETSQGGLATTPTGKRLAARFLAGPPKASD